MESISVSRIVARLSVIITESNRKQAALPSLESQLTKIRLAWPRRARLLEIMATMV